MILNIFGILSEVLIGSPDENGVDRKGLLEFVMDFFDYLVSLFDFSNFDIEQMSNIATNIVNGIIAALNTIDTKQFSSAAGNIIKGITDAVAGIDLDQFNLLALNILQGLLDILGSVDVAGLTTKAGQILVNLISALASLDYTSLTTKLIDFLSSFIGAIADLPFNTFGTKIGEIVNNLLKELGDEIIYGDLAEDFGLIVSGLISGIIHALAEVDWASFPGFFDALGEMANALVAGIKIGVLRAAGFDRLAQREEDILMGRSSKREEIANNPYEQKYEGKYWLWQMSIPDWLERMDYEDVKNRYLGGGNVTQEELDRYGLGQNLDGPSGGGGGGFRGGGFGEGGGFGPMPAPRVTPDQIEESATEFVTGFNTRISSPESVESASSSWNNFGIRLTQTTAPYTNTVGTNMAANLVTGFSTNFQVDSTQTSYNEILFSLNRWLLANASNLQKVGNSISSQIIGGINTGLNQGTLNISRFLYNSSESMKFVGYNIGVDLIRGMVRAIAENKAFLVMAIDRPLEIDLFNYVPNPYSGRAIQDLLEVTTGAASVAASSTPSAAGTSVNITIQGNVIGNQAFITEVTNAVMESLRRSGRLT